MAQPIGSANLVHRTRQSLGKRLDRVVQRQAARRVLDREIFFTLEEAKTLIARWREEYNHVRPHSALGYRPPAPQAWLLAKQLISAPGLT